MTPGEPPVLDLRLLLPCLTAWAIGARALAWPAPTRATGAAIAALVLVLLVVAGYAARRLLAPSAPTADKRATYESGVDPVGRDWAQTQVRYLGYAFLYVIFAVDVVYLFPWALVCAPISAP